MPAVSHRSQSWASTLSSISRTHSWRFSIFYKKNNIAFDAIGTDLVLLRVLLSCVPCILWGRYPWSRSVTYSNTYMMSLLSVPRRLAWNLLWSILCYYYLCTPFILGRDTPEFHICVTPYSCKELFVKKTIRSFQDVSLLAHSKAIFPSRFSIGSTKCDHLYWGKLHDELLFFWGGGILSSSTKRKAPYTHVPGTYDCCVLSGGSCSCYIAACTAWPVLRCMEEV